MKAPSRISFLAALAAPFLFAGSVSAALVIYEGFDYATGDIDGTQNTGMGMDASGWTTTGTSNQFDVVAGLSFLGLPAGGSGAVKRPAPQQNAEMNRAISAASQTDLLGEGNSIWFSLLLRTTNSSTSNANGALVLGTDAFDGPGNKPATMTGGNAFGVTLNGIFQIQAITIDGGVTTTGGSLTTVIDSTYLIAGRIDWTAGTDTMRLFNVTDPSGGTPADVTAFATMTASFDQSNTELFDTLAIADRQVATFDEIRYGDTFDDVMGIPEPSGLALLALGTLGLIRRRR